ncbi:MAG: hypothetical protein KJZ87_03985 [Thermoguttaceae bacterium]|nr:hypothetical protein [Thermoguttaceae bacterium]
MSDGLETTFRVLRETSNEAATPVLVAALDSPQATIREWALAAILARRSASGCRAVVNRLHTLAERPRRIVYQHQEAMAEAIREAILSADEQACSNGCLAAAWFREYEVMPTLVHALESGSRHGELLGRTLVETADSLCRDLADPNIDLRRGDPQLVRWRVLEDLERSVERFHLHQRAEIVTAFLLLVNRDNITLKRILLEPHHVAFAAVAEEFSQSASAGVVRLLLSFLDDPQAPSAALGMISRRCDERFLASLLHKLARESSPVQAHNLRRINSLAWIEDSLGIVAGLDEQAQRGAVRLFMGASVGRSYAFEIVKHLLLVGKPAGRRAAAEALADFCGAEANELVLLGLEHEDPCVQAALVSQLRSRGIPGTLPRLLRLIDSPHEVVQKAVRENLAEFSFARFLAAFDTLEAEVRRSTGLLVRKIDPQAIPLLVAELQSKLRVRRLRALEIAEAMEAVPAVARWIADLRFDQDIAVRTAAAAVLLRSEAEVLRRPPGDGGLSGTETSPPDLGFPDVWPFPSPPHPNSFI